MSNTDIEKLKTIRKGDDEQQKKMAGLLLAAFDLNKSATTLEELMTVLGVEEAKQISFNGENLKNADENNFKVIAKVLFKDPDPQNQLLGKEINSNENNLTKLANIIAACFEGEITKETCEKEFNSTLENITLDEPKLVNLKIASETLKKLGFKIEKKDTIMEPGSREVHQFDSVETWMKNNNLKERAAPVPDAGAAAAAGAAAGAAAPAAAAAAGAPAAGPAADGDGDGAAAAAAAAAGAAAGAAANPPTEISGKLITVLEILVATCNANVSDMEKEKLVPAVISEKARTVLVGGYSYPWALPYTSLLGLFNQMKYMTEQQKYLGSLLHVKAKNVGVDLDMVGGAGWSNVTNDKDDKFVSGYFRSHVDETVDTRKGFYTADELTKIFEDYKQLLENNEVKIKPQELDKISNDLKKLKKDEEDVTKLTHYIETYVALKNKKVIPASDETASATELAKLIQKHADKLTRVEENRNGLSQALIVMARQKYN